MASSSAPFVFLALTLLSFFVALTAANFYQDFDITWGDGRGKMLDNGDLLSLSLDKASGSGFQSKNEFLFGKIDMQLKLVPGNSAGTVTAYYLSSKDQHFHTYSILWNPQRIIFSVDGTPIREFKNLESIGVAFPNKQAMRIYSSIWNADDWATRGGLVKTDWSQAPLLLPTEISKLMLAYRLLLELLLAIRLLIHDTKRFPQGLPPECNAS
ncbi:hypothetical protein SLA2020_441820 [Shorea laevis]